MSTETMSVSNANPALYNSMSETQGKPVRYTKLKEQFETALQTSQDLKLERRSLSDKLRYVESLTEQLRRISNSTAHLKKQGEGVVFAKKSFFFRSSGLTRNPLKIEELRGMLGSTNPILDEKKIDSLELIKKLDQTKKIFKKKLEIVISAAK